MSDEIKNTGAGSDRGKPQAGSPSPNDIGGPAGPVKTGEPASSTEQKIDEGKISKVEYDKLKSNYEALEKKLGDQGVELGENRELMESLRPLMERLNDHPELITAITSGKLTGELAKAALEGKVTIEEAATVTKAHEEVKKELGKTEYNKTSSEDIEKLVTEKIEALSKKFDSRIDESEEIRRYTDDVRNFLASKGDKYDEYASAIDEWRKEHPDVNDIRVIWDAVVGAEAQKAKSKKDEETAGESAKEVAANATGGSGSQTGVIRDNNLVDQLIAGKSNPNVF